MLWRQASYIAFLVIATGVTSFLALHSWRRRSAPGSIPLILLMLGVAEWALTYALELGHKSLASKLLFDRLEFIGIVIVPAAWLLLVLEYLGFERLLKPSYLWVLLLEPLATLALVWTNQYHGLIWRYNRLVATNGIPILDSTPGTGFWLHTAYSYLVIIAGALLLVRSYFRMSSLYRRQVSVLLSAASLPLLANALANLGLNPFPGLDLTPFAFTLTAFLVSWDLFHFQFLNIMPIAREAVIDAMSEGVMVLDRLDRVVDLNPAAQGILACTAGDVIGRPMTEVLPRESPGSEYGYLPNAGEARFEMACVREGDQRHYDLHLTPFFDQGGRQKGRLVVISDISPSKQAEILRLRVGELRGIMNDTINAMAFMVEIRDPYTAGHQKRVMELACAMAVKMGVTGDQIEGLKLASLIHDIGKICVPVEILSKPVMLTAVEFSLIRSHPRVGFEILRTIDFSWPIAEIVYQHHERLNGSGYPRALSAGEILPEARILGVADVVEAMSSDRPYRPALKMAHALQEIMDHRGVLYEEAAVDACLELFVKEDFRFTMGADDPSPLRGDA